MSEPFIGEIRMFGFNFPPRGWALCDGQLLSVAENDALFSLLGTIYGGDGRTTFALPDLRGRVALHAGSGTGLTPRNVGSRGGAVAVSLNATNLPAHTHAMGASSTGGTTANPAGNYPASVPLVARYQNVPGGAAADTQMKSDAISPTGVPSVTHDNLQPTQCVSFAIALSGVYPSRA